MQLEFWVLCMEWPLIWRTLENTVCELWPHLINKALLKHSYAWCQSFLRVWPTCEVLWGVGGKAQARLGSLHPWNIRTHSRQRMRPWLTTAELIFPTIVAQLHWEYGTTKVQSQSYTLHSCFFSFLSLGKSFVAHWPLLQLLSSALVKPKQPLMTLRQTTCLYSSKVLSDRSAVGM